LKKKGIKMAKKRVFSVRLKGAQRFTRLYAGADREKGLRSGLVSLKAKESVGEHNTGNKEEAIIVLKGRALLHYGSKGRMEAPTGSFIYIPPQTRHDIENPGRALLQYVYVTACCA
jgi:quercetin dioxygenase-like cupin family protein